MRLHRVIRRMYQAIWETLRAISELDTLCVNAKCIWSFLKAWLERFCRYCTWDRKYLSRLARSSVTLYVLSHHSFSNHQGYLSLDHGEVGHRESKFKRLIGSLYFHDNSPSWADPNVARTTLLRKPHTMGSRERRVCPLSTVISSCRYQTSGYINMSILHTPVSLCIIAVCCVIFAMMMRYSASPQVELRS
jgi:hypothetical protein